jgi:2'-5' RNA ligase
MSGLCSGGTGSGDAASGGVVDTFALVAYLPEPLAGFVNLVRHELAPGCRLRAHITLLPPRQIACDVAFASRQVQAALGQARAFRIELKDIQVFPVSEVVHLSIGAGCRELKELHAQLNHGPCLSSELWNYQPHVTLAQGLDCAVVAHAREIAEQRWKEYAGPRDFTLDKVAFVQGSADRGWVDLESFELLSPVLA